MISTEGEIHPNCPKCGRDYAPNTRWAAIVGHNTTRSPKAVQLGVKDAHFSYLRLIGGPKSKLFGHAKTVPEAKQKMLNNCKVGPLWKAPRNCNYPPRHLPWDPNLKVETTPDRMVTMV